MVSIKFKKLHPNAIIPKYAKSGDAGMDLCACLDLLNCRGNSREEYKTSIFPRKPELENFTLIPIGLSVELPKGYEAQIRPRSGLALKHGITVLNSPGTIDSGYRGPIGIILINNSNSLFIIENDMRIAQMVIKEVPQVEVEEVEELSDTDRGQGGFGSTGTK